MIADLGAETRPALYDLCAKYRSGVLVCYIKKPWRKMPVTVNIVPFPAYRTHGVEDIIVEILDRLRAGEELDAKALLRILNDHNMGGIRPAVPRPDR